MKIGIDISQIVYEGTGVARFTSGLVDSILVNDKKNEWVFFFSSLRRNLDRSLEQKILSQGHKLIKRKLPATLLSFLTNDIHNFFLSSKIYNLGSRIDFFITSDWSEPLLSGVKKATVVHDLTCFRYPDTVDQNIRKTQEKRLQHVKKESQIIFADSNATKKDLVELLNIQEDRIVVNYPGVEVTKQSKNQINKTLKKYNLEEKKFILTVGKLEPRKNLSRLFEAFKQLNNNTLQLIEVGPKGWGKSSNIKHLTSNINFLGFVPDDELYSLYTSCLFFVFPSIWEGFGYPIIEAMRSGAPVTCSNSSSIREIAGDAALFFDPLNIENMYQSINRLIQDENLRKQLIKKGIQRSKIFTWKKYYESIIYALMSFPRKRESREGNYMDSGSSPE
jgi:glycosyltransferase involved in cell wall biosynthesis